MKKTVKPNTCSRFAFPLLKIPSELFTVVDFKYGQEYYSSRYINSYFGDESVPHLVPEQGYIFVMHSNNMDNKFEHFEKELESYEGFFDSYDICKGKFGVKIFKIPEESMKDYNLILQGKFSSLSNQSKVRILDNPIVSDNIALEVLSKSPTLKSDWEEIIGESIGDLDVWPVIYDKYQQKKEFICEELKKSIHVESMVPEEDYF